MAGLGGNGGGGIFGQQGGDQFPRVVVFLLGAANLGGTEEALAREFGQVVVVQVDFLVVGDGQVEGVQRGFADPLIQLGGGEFFGGERFQGLGKGEHRFRLHFIRGVGAFDDPDPKLESGGIFLIPVVVAGFGQGLGAEEVGLLDLVGPRVVAGKFGKIFFRLGFPVCLEIDLAETKKGGGLGVLAGIFCADLGGKLLADPFKDGTGLLPLSCGEQGLGKALEILPIEGGLGGQGLFVRLLVKAEGEGGLAGLVGDAGLGEEDLGNEGGAIAGLAGEVAEGLETILHGGFPGLEAEKGEGHQFRENGRYLGGGDSKNRLAEKFDGALDRLFPLLFPVVRQGGVVPQGFCGGQLQVGGLFQGGVGEIGGGDGRGGDFGIGIEFAEQFEGPAIGLESLAFVPFLGEERSARDIGGDIARIFRVGAELLLLVGEHQVFFLLLGVVAPDSFVRIQAGGGTGELRGGGFPGREGLLRFFVLQQCVPAGEEGVPEVGRFWIGRGKGGEGGRRLGEFFGGAQGVGEAEGSILLNGGGVGGGGEFGQLGHALGDLLFRDEGAGVGQLGLLQAFLRDFAFAGLHIGQEGSVVFKGFRALARFLVGGGDVAGNFVRVAGIDPFFLCRFEPLDGLLILGVLQQGKSDEVIDEGGHPFLVGKGFLVFFDKAIGLRGPALEGVGEDDLLLGGGEDVRGAVACDLAEHDAGLVVLAGLEKGLAELEKGLAGEIGPIFNILDFLLGFLDAAELFRGGGGLAGDLGAERGEFSLQLGDQLVAARDGAEAGDGLGKAARGEVEVGELQVGLEGQGGFGAVGDAGVDLARAGEGGLAIRLFEIGQKLAGPFGLRVALEVIDILAELLCLIGFAGGIQRLAGLGKGSQLDLEPGLEEEDFAQGFGVGKLLGKGGEEREGFRNELFTVCRFFRCGPRLGREGLENVVGGLLFDIFLLGDGLELSVGGDGVGPLAQVVLGAGEEEVGTGQVGGGGEGLDVGSGQFGGFLEAFVVVGLDDFFGGLGNILGREGNSGKDEGEQTGKEEQEAHSAGQNRGRAGSSARRTWGIFPLLPRRALGMLYISMICTLPIHRLRTV